MSRPFGIDCSWSSLKFAERRGRRCVDDWRFAGHRDGFLQRRERELDVDVRGEAERNDDALTPHRVESGQLIRERVGAGRDCREPVVSGLGSDRGLRAEHRRTRRGDGHAGQHRALRIDDPTLNRAGAAGTTALRVRRRGYRETEHGDQQTA